MFQTILQSRIKFIREPEEEMRDKVTLVKDEK